MPDSEYEAVRAESLKDSELITRKALTDAGMPLADALQAVGLN